MEPKETKGDKALSLRDEFDSIKALDMLIHDGPGGTIVPHYVIPVLEEIRDEIKVLRSSNEIMRKASDVYNAKIRDLQKTIDEQRKATCEE